MRSLIENYAIEMKDKDGKATGHFFLDKASAQSAAKEVVKTHGSNDKTLLDNFEDTWNHFDVNKDALVEVERMPQFFRYMLGNALAIGL
jgi:hypothetical protein